MIWVRLDPFGTGGREFNETPGDIAFRLPDDASENKMAETEAPMNDHMEPYTNIVAPMAREPFLAEMPIRNPRNIRITRSMGFLSGFPRRIYRKVTTKINGVPNTGINQLRSGE
jgi:hypothetical protein